MRLPKEWPYFAFSAAVAIWIVTVLLLALPEWLIMVAVVAVVLERGAEWLWRADQPSIMER